MRTCSLMSAVLLAVCGLVGGTASAQVADSYASSAFLPGDGSVVAMADNPAAPAPGAPLIASQEEAAADDDQEPGFRLFRSAWLDSRRINLGGWLDQGFTWNSHSPRNRWNGPVGFNDRSNEYQMNQLYLFAERVAKTDGRGFDLGGRVDLLYGTDHRYTRALGLESTWVQDERFYGLSMPQLYGDVALNDLTIRAGRFYAPLGYESVMSPQNFFYSHSYTFLYGEPLTLTGIEAIYKLNDRLSVFAGGHQGWDVFNDSEAQPGLVLGFTWKINEKNDLAWTLVVGDEPTDWINQYRMLSSLVWTHRFSDRFRYVLQCDFGRQDHVETYSGPGTGDWCGLVNYLIYDLNPCWSVGMRYEYFVDRDGTRIFTAESTPPMLLYGIPSDWQELSLGVNYKPNNNVLVRSELRWDAFDSRVAGSPLPFNNGHSSSQFLWGTDLIVKY